MSLQEKGNQIIWDYAAGYLKNRLFNIVLENSICDLLEDGPKSVKQLSDKINMPEEAVNRLMRYFVANEIFGEDKENIGTFCKTETSSLFIQGSTFRMTAERFGSNVNYKMFEGLSEAFKTNKSNGPQSIGFNHIFDIFEHDQTYKEKYTRHMKNFTNDMISSVTDNIDILGFSSYDTIVDIGGSHGLLIGSILDKCPNVNGINFDLQVVLDDKSCQIQHPRLKHVGGSFFESVPSSQCYVIKNILHDWDKDDCVKILKTIGSSMKENGKVYVIDIIMDPTQGITKQQVFMDMMMKQLYNAKERTTTEWAELFDLAGFKLERTINEIKTGCMVISKK